MLITFTSESFEPYLNRVFRINHGSGTLEVRLTECQRHPGAAAKSGPREPFSLIFLGPRQPILPQRMYAFDFGELGSLEIFIVPIGSDNLGTKYEAVFG